VGDIEFLSDFSHKKSNKLQKNKFWNEKKQLSNVFTFSSLQFNLNMISFHIWLFKNWIYALRKNVNILHSTYFVMVHTWANGIGHISICSKINKHWWKNDMFWVRRKINISCDWFELQDYFICNKWMSM